MAGAGLATLLVFTADQARASYSAQVLGTTLQVTGDRDSDRLALRLQPGAPDALVLDVGADGTADFTFDRTTFAAVNVLGGGGDDQISIDRSGGTFNDERVTLDGGTGDDTLNGGDGDDVLAGGSGDDVVNGARGADGAFGGNGADSFPWNPGDGSDRVEGEGGKDVMDFNGSNADERVTVSANGSRVRFLRDVAAVTMDLGTLERVEFQALGGADTITVGDLSATDLQIAAMDLNAGAGGGDAETDTVIVNGTAASDRLRVSSPVAGEALVSGLSALVQVDGSETPLDRVLLNTLGGDDTVASGVGVSGPAAIVFLGGLGNDSARYAGTDYDDAVSITPNGTSVRAASPGFSPLDVVAVESLTVQGFRGDDTLGAANGIAAFTHLTLDGGDGDDVLGGGDGNDTLLGGDDDDVVDGNRGTDAAGLGTGDDHFVWDPGDGNDSVRGQSGYDVMDFNGSNADEIIDVFPNGTRTRLTRNVAAITMDFDTLEDVAVNALGGADTITVFDLSRTGVDTADIDLGGGDAKPDTVIVNGTTRRDSVDVTRYGSQVLTAGLAARTRITGSEAGTDTLRVNTLAGNDDVTVAPDVNDLIATLVDLGIGE